MARVHLPRSMAEDAFRSPLAIMLLMRGGSRIGHATLERSRFVVGKSPCGQVDCLKELDPNSKTENA
jgi:hypothetical protein